MKTISLQEAKVGQIITYNQVLGGSYVYNVILSKQETGASVLRVDTSNTHVEFLKYSDYPDANRFRVLVAQKEGARIGLKFA